LQTLQAGDLIAELLDRLLLLLDEVPKLGSAPNVLIELRIG
jgi:hypothetical protein